MRNTSLLLCAAILGCQTATMPDTGFLARSLTIGATTYPYVVYNDLPKLEGLKKQFRAWYKP